VPPARPGSTLLHEREKFIFVQSSVVVGVGRGKILGVDPAAQFAFVERALMIAIELDFSSCALGRENNGDGARLL
jgi:hypothetical protein